MTFLIFSKWYPGFQWPVTNNHMYRVVVAAGDIHHVNASFLEELNHYGSLMGVDTILCKFIGRHAEINHKALAAGFPHFLDDIC